jgi:hypothetical protein
MSFLITPNFNIDDATIEMLLENMSFMDIQQLRRINRTIRQVLLLPQYKKIFDRKRVLHFYERFAQDTDYHTAIDDFRKSLYIVDDTLRVIDFASKCSGRPTNWPIPVASPTPSSITVRGIHWDSPPDSMLVPSLERTSTGVEYVCLKPVPRSIDYGRDDEPSPTQRSKRRRLFEEPPRE